jgi:hypothetical protein
MTTYTVDAAVKGTEIVTINYLRNGNALDLMSAVASALAHDEDDATPFSVKTVSVHITVNHGEA